MTYDIESQSMSNAATRARTLTERHGDLTRTLILEAALALVAKSGVGALTNRTIAEHAGISERTVYRYFSTRDALLDEVAAAYAETVSLPPMPTSVEALCRYPAELYVRYESARALTLAALHPDLFHRIRTTHGRERWQAMRRLIDEHAPQRSERQREFAAANIRYFLSATAWNYYRSYFQFSLEDSVRAVSSAIEAIIDGLDRDAR